MISKNSWLLRVSREYECTNQVIMLVKAIVSSPGKKYIQIKILFIGKL